MKVRCVIYNMIRFLAVVVSGDFGRIAPLSFMLKLVINILSDGYSDG